MTPLLTVPYWTSLLPPPTFERSLLYAALGIFGGLIAAGIAFRVLARRWKDKAFWAKAAPRFAAMMFTMGILGFLHLWLAYEQVYLWGARFWLIVWDLAFLGWLAWLLRYVFKVLPKEQAEYEEKMRIRKYLP